MTFRHLTVALASLVVAAGCATAPPPDRGTFIKTAHEQFPKGNFIVGYGYDETPEKAEERARVDVATLISSEIQANSKLWIEERRRNGDTTADQTASQEIIQKVSTDAGALVEAQRELTRPTRGGYEAIAIADREKLDEKYVSQSTPVGQKLAALYDRVLVAGVSDADAAAGLCEVDAVEKQFDTTDFQRRLVSGKTGWTDELKARRQQLANKRQSMKSSVAVQIVRDPNTVAPDVVDSLVKTLSARGFAAMAVDAPSCSGKSQLLVKVSLEQGCSSTPFGFSACKASYLSSASRCAETSVLFSVSSDKASANNNSPDLGAKLAIKAINVGKFSTDLSGRLLESLGEGCHK